MPRTALWTLLLAATVALTGCSGDDGEGGDDGSAAPTASAAAESAFSQALAAQEAGDLDTARGLFEEITRNEPDNLLAHYNLGLVHQQSGDDASALAAYEKARG